MGIKVKKSTFKLDLDYKELFISLGLSSIHILTKQADEIGNDLKNIVNSLGIKMGPEYAAWKLITKSLYQALNSLLSEQPEIFKNKLTKEKLKELYKDVEFNLDVSSYDIDNGFFENPKAFTLLRNIELFLKIILKEMGCSNVQAEGIIKRFPVYFVFSLNLEWSRNYNEYEQLRKSLDTPFVKATQKELDWRNYNNWLEKQINMPVLNETFGASDIYIPLRAAYDKKINKIRKHITHNEADTGYENKVVVDLEKELTNWVKISEKDDAIRFLYGDPGCGKSFFSKIFAVKIHNTGFCNVIFIPLQYFDPTGDLLDCIDSYLDSTDFFSKGDVDFREENFRALIIFDGLDELSKQGKVSNEIARNFVNEVERKVHQLNMQRCKVQVLISGRTVAIQSSAFQFSKEKQSLMILPYFFKKAIGANLKTHRNY